MNTASTIVAALNGTPKWKMAALNIDEVTFTATVTDIVCELPPSFVTTAAREKWRGMLSTAAAQYSEWIHHAAHAWGDVDDDTWGDVDESFIESAELEFNDEFIDDDDIDNMSLFNLWGDDSMFNSWGATPRTPAEYIGATLNHWHRVNVVDAVIDAAHQLINEWRHNNNNNNGGK
jgi:hypothetical protein